MKLRLMLFLLITTVATAEPVERVYLVPPEDMGKINAMLAEGWSVKHQAVAATHQSGTFAEQRVVCLFTVVIDSQVLAALEAKKAANREAVLQRQRESLLKKQRELKPEK